MIHTQKILTNSKRQEMIIERFRIITFLTVNLSYIVIGIGSNNIFRTQNTLIN